MVKIYFIGNSITDTINQTGLKGLAESQNRSFTWGRHMIPGAPLNWIWEHPNDGVSESPYGFYGNALSNYQWDGLSLQPFDRSLEGGGGDLVMANNFINLAKSKSPNLQVYIYQRWPRKPEDGSSLTADKWNSLWTASYTPGGSNVEARDYFNKLAQAVAADHPELKTPIVVPVGEVLYQLNNKMKAGQVPGYSSIWDLYTDGIHLNNIGSYVAGATYYAAIYRASPENTAIPAQYGSINSQLTQIIQQTIWQVVDSAAPIPIPTPNPDSPSTPPLILAADASVIEGQDSKAVVTVTLSKASSETVTVNYTTENGSAIAGSDYSNSSGTLTFAPGTTQKTIEIPILADATLEPEETFIVKLSNPSNANLTDKPQATITIGEALQSNVSAVLPEGITNLILTGTDDINGTGNSGKNTIVGNSGNNVLDGKANYDTLKGGAGNDTYIIEGAWWDQVVEKPNEGNDTVKTIDSYTLAANVENLILLGNEDKNGTGNELDNVITGNSGNNVLDGGIGKDTLQGLAGNDTYLVDDVNDVVNEAQNEGNDTIRSSVNYTLPNNVENLLLLGNANLTGTGNTLSNNITGNSGDNSLNGGEGKDTCAGGAGNDLYFVDSAEDVIVEDANQGFDIVRATISYIMPANVEQLIMVGDADNTGIGNKQNNTLNGGAGNDTLAGGAGTDTLLGALGADVLVSGAGKDILAGGAGADYFVYSATSRRNLAKKSRIVALDYIRDFNPDEGDRICINTDNNLATKEIPQALFYAGRQQGRNLQQATQNAYDDRNGRVKGEKSLPSGAAILFGWRGRAFLSINAGSSQFNRNQDMLIEVSNNVLSQNSVKLGAIPTANYFG